MNKGYEYHCCAAANPQNGALLGLIHDTLINTQGPDDRDNANYDYEPLFACFSNEEQKQLRENHRHQMAVHINELAASLQPYHPIHIADREFDDIFILHQCNLKNADFVIRASSYRNVQVQQAPWIPIEALTKQQTGHLRAPGWVYADLRKLVAALPLADYKELPLDARGRATDESSAARMAKLSIGSTNLRLYRIVKRNYKYFKTPSPIDVNLVVIRELNPPVGVEPICWVIFTSLPVDSLAQLTRIAYFYELRWKIELFFRLLKSGYRIEESRLDNALKTAKLLVILSLASMSILKLKSSLGLPTNGNLNPDQYDRVKKATRNLDNPKMKLELRLFALIIKLGGWLGRKRDPIGPSVLMRGILQLIAIYHTIESHRSLIEELLQNPDVLNKMFGVSFNDL